MLKCGRVFLAVETQPFVLVNGNGYFSAQAPFSLSYRYVTIAHESTSYHNGHTDAHSLPSICCGQDLSAETMCFVHQKDNNLTKWQQQE